MLLPIAETCDIDDLDRAHSSVVDQTTPPSEIVLVTNQSLSDKVKTKISNLVRTYSTTRHEHFPYAQGLGEVLQEGLKQCSESYVARMDADDISKSNRFSKQLQLLTRSNVDIVGSHLAEFRKNPENPKRIRKVPITHSEISEWMSWRCPMNHPTIMFDREAVLNTGGYRNFPMMEDWDLWARCLAGGLEFKNIDETLVRAKVDKLTNRRGGIDYAKAEFKMARTLSRLGIASRYDTFRHLFFRIPPRLLPPNIREYIYKLAVRDGSNL